MRTARRIDASVLGNEFISKIWSRIKVGQKDQCWEWDRSANRARYPSVRCQAMQSNVKPHRVVYALLHGVTDAEMVVCHSCDNPMCCNPYHLFLGTQKENVADMHAKGRRHCNYGKRHHLNKFSEEVVRKIADDPRGAPTIAKEYGVSVSQVYRIRHREQWQHLWGTAKHA